MAGLPRWVADLPVFATLDVELDLETDEHKFDARHFLTCRSGDQRELIIFSGIAEVDVKGFSTDSWHRGQVRLHIPFGSILPAERTFRADHWVAFVTPSRIFDENQSVNAGFAVDWFGLLDPDASGGQEKVEIVAAVAVRDSDAWIKKVSYQVTLVGEFV